jgi:hypothetical protein
LHAGSVPAAAQAPAVTILYATVRATAETATSYRRLASADSAAWRAQAEATRRLIPDLGERYPRSTTLVPAAADWRDAPRAGLTAAVRLVSAAGR